MNPVDRPTRIQKTCELVDIDSTTGREEDAGAFLAAWLRELGYDVLEQPISPGRFNVYATIGPPRIVFSTHIDCVPPFFPSRVEHGRLYGRGACDAKGTAVCQIAAAERLRAAGHSDIGLLFVVGEERGSEGAKLSAALVPPSAKFLINGEPTDNRLARATRGVYRARLHAHGRAAHSSQPELGESAIEKLIDALVAMRGVSWPVDADLGVTHYTVGVIKGGVAPNVVPPDAVAEVMFRTVGDLDRLSEQFQACVSGLCDIEDVLVVPPVKLRTIPGFETSTFNFTTDIPFLEPWGTPLLLGPGSVTLAHTADEYVEIDELDRAVELYVALASNLPR